MSYSSQQDFIDAFGSTEAIRITNLDSPSASTVNTVILQQALDDAQARMDPYIGGPLDPVPSICVGLCNDIARYFLDKYQPREDVRLRYEDAMRFLRDVASGKASLGPAADGSPTQAVMAVRSLAVVRKFSPDSLGDYSP